jgi:hypothetical protein
MFIIYLFGQYKINKEVKGIKILCVTGTCIYFIINDKNFKRIFNFEKNILYRRDYNINNSSLKIDKNGFEETGFNENDFERLWYEYVK